MTTSASSRQRISACDGVTATFSCPEFQQDGDLAVILLDSATQDPASGTRLNEGADYIVAGSGAAGTAQVTTTIVYPVGKYLCRRRTTQRAQQVEIVANQGVPAATQEAALDRLSLVDEEQDEDLAAAAAISLRFLPGQTTAAIDRAAFAGKYFAGDVAGNPVPSVGTGNDLALRADLAASPGSSLVNFLQSGAGAAPRSLQSKGRDFISVKDFGCVGDGATDDTVGVTAAEAIVGRKYLPAGTFKTTIAPTALRGPYWGAGQIKDSANNLRARWFAAIAAAPASLGNDNSVETWANGDLAKVQIAMEHRITGAATLGNPLIGYTYTNEAYPFIAYLYNSSGWNNGTGDNVGRTAACFHRVKVFQAGQGDAVAYNFSGIVTSSKIGATHFLASPAVSGVNGELTAGVAGAYLNPFETSLSDAGFDVAGVGYVANLNRTNAAGALSVYWAGVRVQSIGAAAVDAILSAAGKFNAGLDFTACNFGATQAAIAIETGQRIYFNAATTDPDGLKYTSLGTDYIQRVPTGLQIYFNGTLALSVGDTKVSANLPAFGNFANDAGAAGGGVAVGQFYRNGSAVMIRAA